VPVVGVAVADPLHGAVHRVFDIEALSTKTEIVLLETIISFVPEQPISSTA